MDVRLSPEQEALRHAAAQVVHRLGPHTVGQLDDLERADKLHGAVADSGWRELRSASAGHLPLASGVEAALVAEELGRGLADTAFLGPVLASELRRLAGAAPSEPGETVAFTADLSTVWASAPGEAQPAIAIDIRGADRALVLVPEPGGYGLAEIGCGGEPGGVDLTRPTIALGAASGTTAVPVDRSLGQDELRRWTALGLALVCADLVGTMRGAVQLACDYAAQRRQYGSAIGSFQAVQHLLADAFVLTEGSRSVALHVAWAVDALPSDDALAAASVAKSYCARAARTVCETTIQVHGGIGNTWECLAHVFLRRALLSSDLLGGAGVSLGRVLAHRGIGSGDGLR